jgi:dihydrofolate synthase/folylpolyglutamate synthase
MTRRDLAAWLDYQQRIHPRSIALGLERVRAVSERLALPRPAPMVITVAGTNGKGSTVAMLDVALRAAGLATGRYTSPHLMRYNERVAVRGRAVDDASLIAAFERIEAARGEIALTYFEFGTLAALSVFAESNLDAVVLEVGMGGRLDAVNIVDPDVAVITTVDLDHCEFLGPDREAIGFEKAGILRARRPAVLGEFEPPRSVLAHAAAIGAVPVRRGIDFSIEPHSDGGATWTHRDGSRIVLPPLRLSAPCQLDNAATALAALHALRDRLGDACLAAAPAVAQAAPPGRLQRVIEAPEVVLDVGHNPQAARELARWLAQLPHRRNIAVFAALGDKDIGGIVAPLQASIDAWHVFGLDARSARGISGAELAERLRATLGTDARLAVHDNAGKAFDAARHAAGPADRILVFGSFLSVAAVCADAGLNAENA